MTRLVRGQPTSDGAGVKLTRLLGTPQLDALDPFGRKVARGLLAVLGDGDAVTLRGGPGAGRLLLLAARPLREPVARCGPFVMNSREELVQAFEEFRAGRFERSVPPVGARAARGLAPPPRRHRGYDGPMCRALLLLAMTGAAACGAPSAAGDAEAGTSDAGAADAGATHFELPAPGDIGGVRPARVQVPAGYDGVTPLPVVFVLGGYSFSAADVEDWLAVTAQVDANHFILVRPEGLRDSKGNPYWNATDTCCDYDGSNPDDDAYLEGLLDELERRFAVDTTRVALLGHSNGAFMGYRLACDHATRWTALASLAGSMWLDLSRCGAALPVSILQVQGTKDGTMPYEGDSEAPGTDAVLERWSALDGCSGAPVEEPTHREYVNDRRAGETVVSRYQGCRASSDVELWKVVGAGHQPDFRPDFTAAVVAWLLLHPRR